MMTFDVNDRVDFQYTTGTKGETIRVVGTVFPPSKNTNPETHFAVKLDVPRVRADSPKLQEYITVARSAVLQTV